MINKYDSIFNNLTDSQFEDILKECGFKFKKVDGEGGLFIGGKRVYSYELKSDYEAFKNIVKNSEEKVYLKRSFYSEKRLYNRFNSFEALEEYELVA